MYKTKTNQKEAVFAAVTTVLQSAGIRFEQGMVVGKAMTREHRGQVNAILFEGFKSGSIELETAFETDSDLKAYISGLQSNWLRKDKRLNGGSVYSPKNPGSKTSSGDPQLKALRALLTQVNSPKEREEIQRHIDARVSAMSASKNKVSIDFSALPPGLAQKYARGA